MKPVESIDMPGPNAAASPWGSDRMLATSSLLTSLALFLVAFDVLIAMLAAAVVIVVPLLLFVELVARLLRLGLSSASGGFLPHSGGPARRAAWVVFFVTTGIVCAPVGTLAMPHVLLFMYLVTRTVRDPRNEWIPAALPLVVVALGAASYPRSVLGSDAIWPQLAAGALVFANASLHVVVLWRRRGPPNHSAHFVNITIPTSSPILRTANTPENVSNPTVTTTRRRSIEVVAVEGGGRDSSGSGGPP